MYEAEVCGCCLLHRIAGSCAGGRQTNRNASLGFCTALRRGRSVHGAMLRHRDLAGTDPLGARSNSLGDVRDVDGSFLFFSCFKP